MIFSLQRQTILVASVFMSIVLNFHVMAESAQDKMRFERPQNIQYKFDGPMGERIRANLESWLLQAPDSNLGMLEMFRVRDRKPVPSLVPWAGEFAGKYLISAIQTMRMVDDSRLDALLKRVIGELIETQSEDGYLGPFPRRERLLGHWDLWGHYHVMLALMMWYEDTGDISAKQCALKAADLICKTYLDSGRRVYDAGSHEMNMAVIHVLGKIYRETGKDYYLQMIREIEEDMKRAGDYYRQGLAGVDFYATPKPRWESLHVIQGLVEIFRITGDETYKTAFENLWRSIVRYDRHNTGGFSTGEQAIGDPYEPGAIETCCTTAWSAMTIDMLYLTADSTVTDELELSLWNSILGSQHPSGRWWTYNTPMDGQRKASAHDIVFQARAGTPELNCCSVNAPRGLGMISEWGLLTDEEGFVINYYGPMRAEVEFQDGVIRLEQKTRYPADGRIILSIDSCDLTNANLRLRIPAWSKNTSVSINEQYLDPPKPGQYLCINPNWKEGVNIVLDLDMSIHTWIGDGAVAGKVSLYYGPLLLAFDSHYNTIDVDEIPTMSLKDLSYVSKEVNERFIPLVLFEFKGSEDRNYNLCDFATAGAYGTHYRSWLPVCDAPPAKFYLRHPMDGAKIPVGPNVFEWTGLSQKGLTQYILSITKDISMQNVVATEKFTKNRVVLEETLSANETYYWHVTASNPYGNRIAELGPRAFTVDRNLPNPYLENPALVKFREDGLVTASPLDGNAEPIYGALKNSAYAKPAPDRHNKENGAIELDGRGMIRYQVPYFPEDSYTFMAWVCPEEEPESKLSQIFCAWAKGGDDPLRVVIEDQKLYARIEGQGGVGTKGYPVTFGQWIHIAVVKEGHSLSLFINGQLVDETHAPSVLRTSSKMFALGGNPLHKGNEFFKGRIDDFSFYAKSFSKEEIEKVFSGI